MQRWISIVAAASGGMLVAAIATATTAHDVWNRGTSRLIDRMTSLADRSHRGAPTVYDPARELPGLPAPVRRYFEFALTPGQPMIAHARVVQRGEFSTDGIRWSPFTARQEFTTRPPGFVWDANIEMMPLAAVHVRDSYVNGVGTVRAKAAVVVSVANETGTQGMARGSLSRYLAEATWIPTALLPSGGVRWSAIDDSTARATITDGTATVSLDVHFAPRGEIVRMTGIRERDVGGSLAPTPWVTYARDYVRIDGMMVPLSGEAEWVLDGRHISYFRGRLDPRYEFTR